MREKDLDGYFLCEICGHRLTMGQDEIYCDNFRKHPRPPTEIEKLKQDNLDLNSLIKLYEKKLGIKK